MFLNPKHLQPFLTIHQTGSMKKASDKLRRSRSAVSYALDELESTLGVALFERNARGMLLTDFGKLLLRRAEQALGEMRTARLAFNEMRVERGIPCSNAPIFTLSVGERRLGVLIAFAEHKHMGAVASLMGISQPAVSQAMRELDLSTGLPLLEKADGAMRLTAAGRLLLLHVKRALAQLRLACAEIALMKGQLEGQITVGALPFGGALILPLSIARLISRYPQLRVHTIEGSFNHLAASLWCGDIDLMLGALQPVGQYTTLISERLFDDRIDIIARAGHPLTRSADASLREALAMPWVLPIKGSPTREALVAGLRAQGLPAPNVTVETSDLSTIRGLLLRSDLITAAAHRIFHHELESGLLKTLPLQAQPVFRSIGILRRSQDHLSPGAQLLIEEIRAIGAAHANGGSMDTS